MRRTKITLRQLESFLYKSADKLRSQMDASGCRNGFDYPEPEEPEYTAAFGAGRPGAAP
jgi:hypothetical protein